VDYKFLSCELLSTRRDSTFFFASSAHVALGAQRGLSEKCSSCTCIHNFQQLQKWFKQFLFPCVSMLPPAPTVTLHFSSRANMASNAHMRFIFIWFLDIFFTYLRNTLESM